MRANVSYLVLFSALLAVNELVAQSPADGRCPQRLGLVRAEGETSAGAPAREPGPAHVAAAPENGVIRVDTELVITEFTVKDKRGRPVRGLTAADLRVEEDGVEQNIEIFSFGKASAAIARSVVLVIDYSQSQAPYIETSVEAAKVLVDMLEANDRMAIVTDDVELLVGFTSDKSELKSRLERLKVNSRDGRYGKSLQMTALNASVLELFNSGDKRPIVIFQTDGDEYAQLALWRRRWSRGECAGSLRSFADLEKALETAGTTVYSVIPGLTAEITSEEAGDEQLDLEQTVKREARMRRAAFQGPMKHFAVRNWAKGRLRDAEAIEQLSIRTGGISQFLDRPENASAVYRRILDEMNNRYLLGYYPRNSSSDGGNRSIKVILKNASGFKVNGKTSYTPRR